MANVKPGPQERAKSVKITSRTTGTGEDGEVLTVTFSEFDDFPERWNSLSMKIGGQYYRVILNQDPNNAPYTSPLNPSQIILFQPLPATNITFNKDGGIVSKIFFDGTEMYTDIPYSLLEINVLESDSIKVHNEAGMAVEFKLCFNSFRDCGIPVTINDGNTKELDTSHFPKNHRSLLYPAGFTGENGPDPEYRSPLPVFYNPTLVGAPPISLVFTEEGWEQSSFMPTL